MTELERIGELAWLRKLLLSGRARGLVKHAGLSSADVARIIGVAQPNAWRYLASRQFPRRAVALRLVELLTQLDVIERGSEDVGEAQRR